MLQVGQLLYLAQQEAIEIYDLTARKLLPNRIEIRSQIYKMVLLNEQYVAAFEILGFVQVVRVDKHAVETTEQYRDIGVINAIVPLAQDNQFALGTRRGVYMCSLSYTEAEGSAEKGFKLVLDSNRAFFRDENVQALALVKPTQLLIACEYEKVLKVFDLEANELVSTLDLGIYSADNSSGYQYLELQRCDALDSRVLLKTPEAVYLVELEGRQEVHQLLRFGPLSPELLRKVRYGVTGKVLINYTKEGKLPDDPKQLCFLVNEFEGKAMLAKGRQIPLNLLH
jgi:hypothetical protein